MKHKIGYVVLHYNSFDVTKKCVDSILRVCSKTSKIILVDNNSSNDSGLLLDQEYTKYPQVYLLSNKENLGFAKGNNIGYCAAKNIFQCDIIVDMNNDVEILQRDFEKKLISLIECTNCDVIAPNIVNDDGVKQNPLRLSRLSNYSLKRTLFLYRLLFVFSHVGLFYRCFKFFFTKRFVKKRKTWERRTISNCYNIVPHGACIIFLSSYIEKTDFAFPPITFFYGEEDVLFDYLTINNYVTFYANDLLVRHHEKSSTNLTYKTNRERDKFVSKNVCKSIKATLKYRKKYRL